MIDLHFSFIPFTNYFLKFPFFLKHKSFHMKIFFLSLFILFGFFEGKSQVIDGVTDSLPENIRPDYEHAPFYHGVASFDPTPNQVIIWTKITPIETGQIEEVLWEIALDSGFTQVVQSGISNCGPLTNYTLSKDLVGLPSLTKFYYRFKSSDNRFSTIGETQTAPAEDAEKLTIGIASCSSVYSGFFGAYHNLASRPDVFCIIHLGDYIYDFVDENEQIRIPFPYPENPNSLDGYRQRHAYYLLDPELRYARQHKPFILNWDNHDIDNNPQNGQVDKGIQAFFEYCPWRKLVDSTTSVIYRKFAWGNLVDYRVTDQRLWRYQTLLPSGQTNLLGQNQFNWLCQSILESNSKWKIIGSQKMFGGWYTNGIPAGLLNFIPNDGNVFDNGGWDGFPETRNMLLDTLALHQVNNCIFISGDAHMTFAIDISKTPQDPTLYNPETGEGSLAVELLPTSISRGNFDEQGVPESLANLFVGINKSSNPHHFITDFTRHGYGLLHFTQDSVVAQVIYCNKDELNYTYDSINSLVLKNGENHWSREYKPTETGLFKSIKEKNWNLYPNPSEGGVVFLTHPLSIEISDTEGKIVFKANGISHFSTKGIPKGIYTVKALSNGKKRKLVIN